MVDDGLSFGTNHEAGVCIHFAEQVPSRLSRRGHSALTVTVADLEGLTLALGGDPGAGALPAVVDHVHYSSGTAGLRDHVAD
jgi:hypothetical protein